MQHQTLTSQRRLTGYPNWASCHSTAPLSPALHFSRPEESAVIRHTTTSTTRPHLSLRILCRLLWGECILSSAYAEVPAPTQVLRQDRLPSEVSHLQSTSTWNTGWICCYTGIKPSSTCNLYPLSQVSRLAKCEDRACTYAATTQPLSGIGNSRPRKTPRLSPL